MRSKNYRHMILLTGLILIAITIYGWLNLPEQIVIHFDSTGQPDNFISRDLGLLIIPALTAGLFAFFKALPRIDPLGENIEDFSEEYRTLIVSMIVFLSYIQAMIILWNLDIEFSISQAIIPAVAGLYYLIGDIVTEARQNWFIGIRTPWTLSDEDVWNRTHQRIGPLFKASGLVALAGLLIPDLYILLITIPVIATSLYAAVYSYREYQRKH